MQLSKALFSVIEGIVYSYYVDIPKTLSPQTMARFFNITARETGYFTAVGNLVPLLPLRLKYDVAIAGATDGEYLYMNYGYFLNEYWDAKYDDLTDHQRVVLAIAVTHFIFIHEHTHKMFMEIEQRGYNSFLSSYGDPYYRRKDRYNRIDVARFSDTYKRVLRDRIVAINPEFQTQFNKPSYESMEMAIMNWVEDYAIEKFAVQNHHNIVVRNLYHQQIVLGDRIFFTEEDAAQIIMRFQMFGLAAAVDILSFIRNDESWTKDAVSYVFGKDFAEKYINNMEKLSANTVSLHHRAGIAAEQLALIYAALSQDEQQQDGDGSGEGQDGEGEGSQSNGSGGDSNDSNDSSDSSGDGQKGGAGDSPSTKNPADLTQEEIESAGKKMESLGDKIKEVLRQMVDKLGESADEALKQAQQKAQDKAKSGAGDGGQVVDLDSINNEIDGTLETVWKDEYFESTATDTKEMVTFVDCWNTDDRDNHYDRRYYMDVQFIEELRPFAYIFRSRRNPKLDRFEQRYGDEFDSENLRNIIIDGRIFADFHKPRRSRGNFPAVNIVIDVSGSTASTNDNVRRNTLAADMADVAYTLHTILADAGVPVATYAHSTNHRTASEVYFIAASNGAIGYDGYPDHCVDNLKERFDKASHMYAYSGNCDGMALAFVTDRFPEDNPDRIVIMINDGEPSESFSGQTAINDLLSSVERAWSLGVKVFAFAAIPQVLRNLKRFYNRGDTEDNVFTSYGTDEELEGEIERIANRIIAPIRSDEIY